MPRGDWRVYEGDTVKDVIAGGLHPRFALLRRQRIPTKSTPTLRGGAYPKTNVPTGNVVGVLCIAVVVGLMMLDSSGTDTVQTMSAQAVTATATGTSALQLITSDNARQLTLLPRIGYGSSSMVAWSA